MRKLALSLIYVVSLLFVKQLAQAQVAPRMRISLLTCTPGEELYSTFGHSAIRVIDSNSVSDLVYNYGTFNFNDDGFYVKFIRGKLMYYISIERFDEFTFEYQASGRGITEQVLDLNDQETHAIADALHENLKEENKFYKYDFFLDNCTTRLRDLIVKNKHPQPFLPAVMPENFRFRQAIHQYLDQNHKDWSKLGIDLLLGARCDAIMTGSQQQFLPDNLMIALDSAKRNSIVSDKKNLYPVNKILPGYDIFTPMFCFSLLLIVFLLLSLIPGNRMRFIMQGLDGLLLFFTGLMGLLFIFMWLGTDHSMTKDNYNLLWAWPTHLVAAFFVRAGSRTAKTYFTITSIAMLIVLATWLFLPQQMNNALVPLVILLLIRSNAYSRRIQAGFLLKI